MAVIKKLPGVAWLCGGWPDEARFVIQSAALRRVLGGRQLEGACLNVGSGEGLYAAFLDSFSRLRRIAHMDLEKRNIASRFPGERHKDFVGSVTALPFDTGDFDACICTEVMEHVVDDGRGFDSNSVYEGNGLHNMKARALEIKARLEINSEKDKGTSILIKLRTT